jgi:MFS family permease
MVRVDHAEGLLFEEAIEQMGMGFFQYKLLFVCGLGWIADTMEMVVFAYCLPYLTTEWPHITNFHKGVLVATAYFGMAVGAVCWSYLSDSIGRRATFVASLLFVIVFGVLSGVLQMHCAALSAVQSHFKCNGSSVQRLQHLSFGLAYTAFGLALGLAVIFPWTSPSSQSIFQHPSATASSLSWAYSSGLATAAALYLHGLCCPDLAGDGFWCCLPFQAF